MTLLSALASYLRTAGKDADIKIIRDTTLASDETALPQSEPEFVRASVVEESSLGVHVVGDVNGSTGFTYFLDGIERTYVPLIYADLVPVVYGFKAAVIRFRDTDRRLSTWRAIKEEGLHFPFVHLEPKAMRDFGIDVYDSATAQKDPADIPPLHPLILRDLARRSINKRREDLERKLADDWMRVHGAQDQWLLVDGSITVSYELYGHPHVVGVIKSHQTQYFTLEEQRRILNLKPGERSSVFEPMGRTRTPVYSWYLRLHPTSGRDAYFGLIRVEAAKSEETLRMVDEISRWLMVERQPLSLPDGRWDKLLYPIRDCEQYLRSIAPSKTMMEAALAGV